METDVLEKAIETFSFNAKFVEIELKDLEEENKVLRQLLKDVDGLTKITLWIRFKRWVVTKRLHMIAEEIKEAEARLDDYLIAEQGLRIEVYNSAINCLEMVIKQLRYDTRFNWLINLVSSPKATLPSALVHDHICQIQNLRNQLIELSKKEKST